MSDHLSIAPDVKLGPGVTLSKFINLYGCEIGDNTKIGAFVEIQKNAKIGKNCKISSHTFICEGVTIEDEHDLVAVPLGPGSSTFEQLLVREVRPLRPLDVSAVDENQRHYAGTTAAASRALRSDET